MASESRTCLFCGSDGKLTSEHVIPRWVGREMGDADTTIESVREWGGERRVHLVRGDRPNATYSGICLTCNSGWLSDLEDAAKAVLTPLCRGRPTELDRQGRETLATWALKTALLLDVAQPTGLRYATPHQYRWLFAKKRPWPGCRVWIAGYGPGGAGVFSLRGFAEPAPLPPHREVKAFVGTLAIGVLVIEVFGYPLLEDVAMYVGPVWSSLFIPVWQDAPERVGWPPDDALTENGLAELREGHGMHWIVEGHGLR